MVGCNINNCNKNGLFSRHKFGLARALIRVRTVAGLSQSHVTARLQTHSLIPHGSRAGRRGRRQMCWSGSRVQSACGGLFRASMSASATVPRVQATPADHARAQAILDRLEFPNG